MPDVLNGLIAFCEKRNCFAIIDTPADVKTVMDLLEYRSHFDSSFAAVYHPWLLLFDRKLKKICRMPPSGAIAGTYALTDNTRGVYKAPANMVVRNCTGLSASYTEGDQSKLNPHGINLIRAFPGQGIRVWGARTMSSQSNFKYVNVRRFMIYLQRSILASTKWALHCPNDELLWHRLTGCIQVFLSDMWRNGALMGASPDEAFSISTGRFTMSDDDIRNGRVLIQVGVALIRPAEFIIFQIDLHP